jgi:hypothetical protein
VLLLIYVLIGSARFRPFPLLEHAQSSSLCFWEGPVRSMSVLSGLDLFFQQHVTLDFAPCKRQSSLGFFSSVHCSSTQRTAEQGKSRPTLTCFNFSLWPARGPAWLPAPPPSSARTWPLDSLPSTVLNPLSWLCFSPSFTVFDFSDSCVNCCR